MHQVGTTHLGVPWWVVVATWPPSLISSSHIITYLQKKITIALSLSLKPADFDLCARSSVSETVSGDCCSVVTPPFVQLVFVLVVYILNN